MFVRLEAQDASDMALLEKRCFTLPWSEEQYRAAFMHSIFYAYGLKHEKTGLVAYITLYAVADTLEVLNVATCPDQRRKGYARSLLDSVFKLARRMDVIEAVLEVRETNAAAKGLYEGLGFTRTGLRKAYYPDTGEDALIYTAQILA